MDFALTVTVYDPALKLYPVTLSKRQRSRRLTSAAKRFREVVFNRDRRECLACGTPFDLSLDHVRPLALGGTNTTDNLQTLCRCCNSAKSSAVVDYRGEFVEIWRGV